MSEAKRWDLWEVILEETDSTWVRWEDYARLKAEVERLRKAGDAMAKVIDDDYLDTLQVWIEWNAAKEGKPSA